MREPPPLAAAPATERSERVGEEAEESRLSDLSTYAPSGLDVQEIEKLSDTTVRALCRMPLSIFPVTPVFFLSSY